MLVIITGPTPVADLKKSRLLDFVASSPFHVSSADDMKHTSSPFLHEFGEEATRVLGARVTKDSHNGIAAKLIRTN
jgi:hypothetical protein